MTEEAGRSEERPPAGEPGGESRAVYWSTWSLEHAQDLMSIVVGVVLVALSAVLLVAGIVDFAHRAAHASALTAANILLDRVLLVLILVEIVHTVVLSLRAHTLVPQPFIVVGLVAVIRKILFILGNQTRIPTAELALLIAMVAVFVAGLIAVSLFGRLLVERPSQDSRPARSRAVWRPDREE